MNSFQALRRVVSGVLLSGLMGVLAGCDVAKSPSAQPSFHGVDITGAEYARQLSLPDAAGRPRTLADFAGKVTVVFFGFTHCPDVCPSTLAELAQVKKALGPDGERLQAVFVTVDPQRDTFDVLQTYMASFDPSFVALRGTPEQTKAVAQEFKVFFAKVPGKVEGSYNVDHTAASYVFDTRGKVRLYVRYGTPVAQLTADIKALLAAAS
jgi:protein SCO1